MTTPPPITVKTREGRNTMRIQLAAKLERIKQERKELAHEWEQALAALALLESIEADYAANTATVH